jgi:ferredoxin
MAQTYTAPSVTKVIDTFEIPQKEKAAGGGAADGKLQNNQDECIYCGICAKNCPQEAIEVNRDEKSWKLDEDKCVKCGLCTEKCPKKCLEIK